MTTAFWTLSTYLLNGALFVLVGLEVQSSVRGLTSIDLARGLFAVAVVSAVVIGVRFVWLFTMPYVIRALDRRPQQRLRRVGARGRAWSTGWPASGAPCRSPRRSRCPQTVASGEPFPGPRPDRLRDRGRHRGDPAPGAGPARRRPVGPAAPGHLRRRGAPARPDARPPRRRWRRCPRWPPSSARPRGGRADPPRVRGAPARRARRRGRRRRAGAAARGAVRRAAARPARPQAGHRARGCGTQQRIDDIVLRQFQTRLDIEEVRLSRREVAD